MSFEIHPDSQEITISLLPDTERSGEIQGHKVTLGATFKQMIGREGNLESRSLYRSLWAAALIGTLLLVVGGAVFLTTSTDLLPGVGQAINDGALAAQFGASFIGGSGATLGASLMLVGGVVLGGSASTLLFFTVRVQKGLNEGEESSSSSSEPLVKNRKKKNTPIQ